MSNRIVRIKLRKAREDTERNLAMAIEHPSFEDKFMAQAIKAETLAFKLEKKL